MHKKKEFVIGDYLGLNVGNAHWWMTTAQKDWPTNGEFYLIELITCFDIAISFNYSIACSRCWV